MMRAVVAIEWLKLRRSRVVLTATAVLVFLLPGSAAAFMAAYLSGGDSQFAAKVSTLLNGRSWADYLGLIGQLSSVGALLSVGIVVCWTYGREFSDGTIGNLFALPISRARIAWAKGLVVLCWGVATSILGVLVAVLLGLALSLDATSAAEIAQAATMPIVVATLTTLLAVPLALVASAGRGYLPGVAALLAVVVVTQIVTTLGASPWFPWAAPALWSGLGGPALSAQVTSVQLAMPCLVGALGMSLCAWWWKHCEVV